MKIFVLVSVSYDYYRFQVNEYAHTSKQKVIDFAKSLNNMQVILDYQEESDEGEAIDNKEMPHFWIETFDCD